MKKRTVGIRLKLFLEIGAIIAICLIGISIVNSQLIENVYIWNIERSMKLMSDNIEDAGENYYSVISEYELKQGVSIDLYDNTDAYLYEGKSNFISGSKLNIISRTENDDGSYFNVVVAEGSTTQYILYGKDFENGYHVEITTEKDPIQENARLATRVTTTISVLALLVALIFISAYSKRFTKPLIEMSHVASNIANLDFSRKCTVKRKDEIGTLAENINTVSDSLNSALTELREKNARLTEDIERERQIERMRSDFISAASHELKTPIAIIRGYAEGLKMSADGESAGVQEYCDIIMHEADRMNSLVLSMLEQSLYSSGVNAPDKSVFTLDAFIEEFLKSALPIFDEKGVTCNYTKGGTFSVFADRSQMTTVLSNIVTNACSHAQAEKRIDISAAEQGDYIKISVFNTGSCIADKDRDSIFTSFYRADKAHSRAEGRFGLGLAIAKSIVDNHGCEIGFENKENGVVFWFTVQKSDSER